MITLMLLWRSHRKPMALGGLGGDAGQVACDMRQSIWDKRA
jgi:hypothetical protein